MRVHACNPQLAVFQAGNAEVFPIKNHQTSTCIYPNQRIFSFGGGHHQVWEQAQPSCIPKADFPGTTWHKWKEHQLKYRGVFMPGVQQGVYGANPVETNMWVGLGTLLQQNLGGWTWSLSLKPPPQRLSVTMATTFLEKTGNISHGIPCQSTLSSLFLGVVCVYCKDINHRNFPQIQVHNRKLLRFCWEWALLTIFKFWLINI